MKTVDRYHLQRFWAIAAPYWRHEEKLKAWGLLALLVPRCRLPARHWPAQAQQRAQWQTQPVAQR